MPIDFSDCSKKALQYAVPIAKQFNAAIIILHVVPRRYTIGEGYYEAGYEPELEWGLRNNAARQLKELAKEFCPSDIPIRIETCLGAEAIEIANAAKKLETDLIVISTHGRTGRAHALGR